MAIQNNNNYFIEDEEINGNEQDWNNLFNVQYIDTDDYSDTIDEIAELEEDFVDSEKEHLNYYLGSVFYYPEYNTIQLGTALSPRTMFAFNMFYVQLYLAEYSASNVLRMLPHVHILQLCIKPDGEYCVIIKTFWLKMVQRAWKKQYAKKKEIIMLRGSITARRHFELTGTYPQRLRIVPGLRGLLA